MNFLPKTKGIFAAWSFVSPEREAPLVPKKRPKTFLLLNYLNAHSPDETKMRQRGLLEIT